MEFCGGGCQEGYGECFNDGRGFGSGCELGTLSIRALLLGLWMRNTPCLDHCTEAARTENSILSLEFVAFTIYPAAVTANILLRVAMEMMCLSQI